MSAATITAVRDALKAAWLHEQGDRLTFTEQGPCVVIGVEPPDMRYQMPEVLTDTERRDEFFAAEADTLLNDAGAELGKLWPVERRGLELVVGPAAARPMGTEGPLLTPGGAEWLRTISASKIAAIAGVSPWDSPFSLYWKMNGTLVEPRTDAMRRGHYLEPAIAQWFGDQHDELVVLDSGTWTHAALPWATASPDRTLAHRTDLTHNGALLEIKSTTQDHEWGEPGSDEVPPYVKVQCLWQLEVTGLDVCHVAVLGSFLEFGEYVVEYDASEAGRLVDMAADFLGKLERREHPPIDGHDATYQAERALHPLIDRETDVELPDDLVRRYVASRDLSALAKQESNEVAALILDEMADARRARWNGQTICTRQARGEGLPYLVAGKSLPTFTNESEAA